MRAITSRQIVNRKKSQLVTNTVIVGLFSIAAMAFLYYLFISKVLVIRVSIKEEETEVHAMNLANVLISDSKIAYVDNDGIVHRGILDEKKINSMFKFSKDSFKNKKEIISLLMHPLDKKKIRYYYQNSLDLIMIVDLDNCVRSSKSSNYGTCYSWGGVVISANFGSNPVTEFLTCLKDSFDNSGGAWAKRGGACTAGAAAGALIGSVVPGVGTAIGAAIGCGAGLVSTIWSPKDISNCLKKSLPTSLKELFFISGSPISHQGLPVLIRYPDGSLHTGRIIVSLIEW